MAALQQNQYRFRIFEVRMSNEPVRKHTRLTEYDYSSTGAYFVTICTRDRRPLFWSGPGVLSPEGNTALNCLFDVSRHIPAVKLDVYSVMPDHVHAIFWVEAVGPPYMAADRSKQTVSRTVQQYKSAVTRLTGYKNLWQSGFYEHVIRNSDDLSKIRQYILNNPKKWILCKE